MAEDRRKLRRPPEVMEAIFVLVTLAAIVGAGLGGWFFGRSQSTSENVIEAAAPAGHTGAGLPPESFGDPAKGKLLFEEKRCSDCHSYNGVGGEDAPPLDYMKGHLSAREIAGMSGLIWNHLPAMLHHFEEEGIPVPTFGDGQMEDLIAYLHSGG